MLLPLVLAAAPVVLPAPTAASFPESLAAACTVWPGAAASPAPPLATGPLRDDGAVRVCKAVPAADGARPGLVVDGPGDRHVEWDATALSGDLDDFQVLLVDLDGDGRDELVVANRAAEAVGVAVRLWELAIVDGAGDGVTHALVHDWGPDAVDDRGRLLLTEWDWRDPERAGLVLIGREYTWKGGRLWPTKAPVLKRRLDAQLEAERASAAGLYLTPRRTLAHESVTRGADTPGKATAKAKVLGVSLEEPFLGLHLQRADGSLETLSALPDAKPLLRLGDARAARLFPMGYAPAEAEAWLLGRTVRVVLDGAAAAGPVWVD
ncbi:MAG: hypothetical protein AB1730_25735 [Myxococcota bacterium]